MDKIQKINRFLDLAKTQHWLQFPGGSGGEFFALLISNYSPHYESLGDITMINSDNRTMTELPKFFKMLASVPSEKGTIDDLCTGIIRDCELLRLDLEQEMALAENFIKDKKYLIRIHYTVNDYFGKHNSFAILPDNDIWLEYTSILKVIKAGGYRIDHGLATIYFDEYTTKRGTNRDRYDRALNWMLDNGHKEIYFGHINCIEYMEEIGSYKDVFNMSLVDIYNFFNNKIKTGFVPWSPVYWPEFINETRELIGDKFPIIEYTKIFQKGYLENMFDITDDTFNRDLLAWHDKNISLLESYGFDTDKFKL